MTASNAFQRLLYFVEVIAAGNLVSAEHFSQLIHATPSSEQLWHALCPNTLPMSTDLSELSTCSATIVDGFNMAYKSTALTSPALRTRRRFGDDTIKRRSAFAAAHLSWVWSKALHFLHLSSKAPGPKCLCPMPLARSIPSPLWRYWVKPRTHVDIIGKTSGWYPRLGSELRKGQNQLRNVPDNHLHIKSIQARSFFSLIYWYSKRPSHARLLTLTNWHYSIWSHITNRNMTKRWYIRSRSLSSLPEFHYSSPRWHQ